MTAAYRAIRHHTEDDLVAFCCADCGATHEEAKGPHPLREVARWVLSRERWAVISEKGGSTKLACPSCLDARRRKAGADKAAASYRRWREKNAAAARG